MFGPMRFTFLLCGLTGVVCVAGCSGALASGDGASGDGGSGDGGPDASARMDAPTLDVLERPDVSTLDADADAVTDASTLDAGIDASFDGGLGQRLRRGSRYRV